ncbi:MAG: LacI family DNA-binding transcriptional regulator [Spirochaetota bacterium]
MASLSEIAQHAGVSKSTVSLVMNNRPYVSQEMRDRVLRAAAELSSTTKPRSVNAQHSPNVLLIHPLSMGSQQVFRELLQGVRTAVVNEGRGQLTPAAHDPPLKPEHATSALLHDPALRPDGVIVMGAGEHDPIIAEAQQEGLPCVLLARQHAPEGTSCVGMDNASGARTAVEHLLGHGHTRIALVGGDESFDYTELRIAGYREAMQAAGLEPEIHLGSGDTATRALISAHPDRRTFPTGIFFINDEHAARGMPVLAEHGFRVPTDASVVGFDDTDNATQCSPPLTSIRVPRFLIGRLAGRTVLDHIRFPELERLTLLLRTELISRESVATLTRSA